MLFPRDLENTIVLRLKNKVMNRLRTIFVLEAKQRLLELFLLFKVVNQKQYYNSGEENRQRCIATITDGLDIGWF